MLYVFTGTDRTRLQKALFVLRDSLLKKKPDASYFEMSEENWSSVKLEEYVRGGGLFNHAHIVYLDNLRQDAETRDMLDDFKKEIAQSPNVFLVLENSFLKKDGEAWKKIATSWVEHSLVEKKKQEFNVFSLAEALGKKDKKSLWSLYTEARLRGLEPESIAGTLVWQMRTILLSQKAPNASLAGLSPFVYSKAVAFSRNFKENEARSLLGNLVSIYHESRRGGPVLGDALEYFLLKI